MRKIRPRNRAVLAAVLSALSVVAVAGCTASRTLATSQPAADEKPKKEYQWKDMSTGRANFRPIGSGQDN